MTLLGVVLFFAGTLFGVLVGIFFTALMVAAGRADRDLENMNNSIKADE